MKFWLRYFHSARIEQACSACTGMTEDSTSKAKQEFVLKMRKRFDANDVVDTFRLLREDDIWLYLFLQDVHSSFSKFIRALINKVHEFVLCPLDQVNDSSKVLRCIDYSGLRRCFVRACARYTEDNQCLCKRHIDIQILLHRCVILDVGIHVQSFLGYVPLSARTA